MRTSKDISNVGYWDRDTASVMFQELCKAENGLVSSVIWCPHKGEAGDKDHYHMLLLGGVMRDTSRLDGYFQTRVNDATGCQVSGWRVTKDVKEWLLYVVHHPSYLIRKGEERDHSYTFGEVLITDKSGTRSLVLDDFGKRFVIEAKRLLDHLPPCNGGSLMRAIRYYCERGYSFQRLVVDGIVPVNNIRNAREAYGEYADFLAHEKNEKKSLDPIDEALQGLL